MTTVAIIGTAGRKDDAQRLNRASWALMLETAERRVRELGATRLVSGGAAWADHLAVKLFLMDVVPALTLHLPAPYLNGAFLDGGFRSAGGTANYYHRNFRQTAGVDGLREIGEALARPGARSDVRDGFKARNSLVAHEAEAMLAFTFGPIRPFTSTDFRPGEPGHRDAMTAGLKDGGTADTWNKATRSAIKIHYALGALLIAKPAA